MRAPVPGGVRKLLRRVLRLVPGRRPKAGRCMRYDVRSESGIRAAAAQIAEGASAEPDHVAERLRELVALNTPALFLSIVKPGVPVRVVLYPWDGTSIRFRGKDWFVDAGSESVEGIEAFAAVPFAHTSALYPVTPDHPVYAIRLEHHSEHVYYGRVPPYVTHVTIMVNGRTPARRERLLHERGAQVWAA